MAKKKIKTVAVTGYIKTGEGFVPLGQQVIEVEGDNIYKGENYFPSTSEGTHYQKEMLEKFNIDEIDLDNKEEPTPPQGGWLMQGRTTTNR